MSDDEQRGQYHFTPERYAEIIAEELPAYGAMHQALTRALRALSAKVNIRRVLDLGVGTGETTLAALAGLQARDDAPEIVGIDVSAEMLALAARRLPATSTLLQQRLEDPLPHGPFDLVVSALAVHHLDGQHKRDLFARLAAVMSPGARLLLADVVIPEQPVATPTPLSPDYDKPDRIDDQLRWLADAGLQAHCVWQHNDLALLTGSLSAP